MTDGTAAAVDGHARRLGRLLTLAGPIVVSRAGVLTMAVADFIMVGRYSVEELAFLALGLSLFIPIMVSGIGGLLGLNVLVSQKFGRGDHAGCLDEFRRAQPFAILLGVLGMGLLLAAPLWLTLAGQSEKLVAGAGSVAQILAPAVLFQLVYISSAFFVEAAQNPRPAMVVMVLANILNVSLNWLLIGGELGAPEMGADGAALSTTLVRLFFVIGMWAYLWRTDFLGARSALAGLFSGGWGPGGWSAGAPLRSLGYAAAISMASETFGYAALNQAAGRLGAEELAAFAVAYNIEAVIFMVGLGVATATGVLVGAEIGRGDRAEAGRAAATGAAAVAVVMATLAALAALFGASLVGLYTTSAEVVALGAALLAVMGVWIVCDGVQLTLAHAVRATGRAWSVALRHAVVFLVVMAPLGVFLAHGLGYGAFGLVAASSAACFTSAVLMALKLRGALRG